MISFALVSSRTTEIKLLSNKKLIYMVEEKSIFFILIKENIKLYRNIILESVENI